MRYFCFILTFLAFVACKSSPDGYIIPWQAPEYTYKDYEGAMNIDSRAFYLHTVLKNAGRCRIYYTRHRDLPDNALVSLAAAGDKEADFELFLRMLPNSYMHDRNGFYTNVHKAAGDYFKPDKQKEALEALDRYAKKSPFALYMKAMILKEDNVDYAKEAAKLKEAGGYYAGLAFAAQTELEFYGLTDRDNFCEAYFNGCDLYRLKQRYHINCGE